MGKRGVRLGMSESGQPISDSVVHILIQFKDYHDSKSRTDVDRRERG